MSTSIIHLAQNLTKDCYAGDKMMDRYAIFNGLEMPRRIDSNLTTTRLGYPTPAIVSVTSVATAGSLENGKWYAYKAVYASSRYLRPTAVLDGSGAYSRGNPSTVVVSAVSTAANSSMSVVVPSVSGFGITHILLYRSLGASSQSEAEAGPFYYVTSAAHSTGNVTITDGVADASVGKVVETDNFAPNAYRYAIAASGYIFAGGNYRIGTGYTCTVTVGSSTVTLSADLLWDGVQGWYFKCIDDTTGGVNGAGLYYANRVSANTLQLVDSSGVAKTYDGSLSGAGQTFILYLAGNTLRWSKKGEPEAWPTTNLDDLPGDITGISTVPNLPLLVVCTDEPSIYIYDLSLVGTYTFKTQKRLISTNYTATSHWSLCHVDTKLRGIDAWRGCIWETDGVQVVDITSKYIPDIWEFLNKDENRIKLWHCAYASKQHLFAAYVSWGTPHRYVDFSLVQNTTTGSWSFHPVKDLLCSGNYRDISTGEPMVLGGTQGLSSGTGAVWGRILCPDVYDEWIPAGSLRSGTVLSGTITSITVDNSSANLYTTAGGLSGRWVLVCDENGEYPQLAYILSNTANTITIDTVLFGPSSTQFSPTPSNGWKFYLGLIEMRWGPKRFDFDDPDQDKKVLELHMVLSDYDRSNLPYARYYRGLEKTYLYQRQLLEGKYHGNNADENQTLYDRYNTKVEPSPRWGVAIVDRAYTESRLRSVSIVFSKHGTNQ